MRGEPAMPRMSRQGRDTIAAEESDQAGRKGLIRFIHDRAENGERDAVFDASFGDGRGFHVHGDGACLSVERSLLFSRGHKSWHGQELSRPEGWTLVAGAGRARSCRLKTLVFGTIQNVASQDKVSGLKVCAQSTAEAGGDDESGAMFGKQPIQGETGTFSPDSCLYKENRITMRTAKRG